uniref:Uncharacterized protein n=1 Tax=Tetranychus urticae TaxID=32264 RepID=T1L5J4_TETUR
MIILLINLLLLCSTTVHSYITWIEARVPLQGNRPAPGTPWPLPKQLNQTEKTLFLNPMEFYFTTNGRFCDILDASLTRYRPIIFQDFNVSTVGFSDRPDVTILNWVTMNRTHWLSQKIQVKQSYKPRQFGVL